MYGFGTAYGPDPSKVLDDSDAAEQALKTAKEFKTNLRKWRARQRYLVYSENFSELIVNKILDTHSDHETRREMGKFVDVTNNPALDITRELCVVWKTAPRRSIKGVLDAQQQAFHSLAKESWLDVHLQKWNQMAFLLGPVTVVPLVKSGRMTWDVLLPHFTDVVADSSNPYGAPLAASWTLAEPEGSKGNADTIVLDGEGWKYFRTTGGRPEMTALVEHGIGEFPGATLRLNVSYEDDWWGGAHNQRLIDGTVNIGVINAALAFTRKAQNKRLLVALGDLGEAAQGQRLDPEIPIRVDAENPSIVDFKALEFDTDPENFIKHALWVYQSLAEAYGASTAYMGPGGTSSNQVFGRFEFTHDALTEIRNEQLPFARSFEHELAHKMVAMAHDQRHPIWFDLPQPEAVKDGYTVEFSKLSRVYAEPRAESEHSDWLLSKGCISQLDILRKDNPTLSDSQLFDMLEANLEVQAKFNDAVTKRNLGMSANQDVQTAAEAFGSMGPEVRDRDRDQKEPEDDQ